MDPRRHTARKAVLNPKPVYIHTYIHIYTHTYIHTYIHIQISAIPDATRQKAVREALRRWHPDKFGQRFGASLYEPHREKILARVKVVSQALTASM